MFGLNIKKHFNSIFQYNPFLVFMMVIKQSKLTACPLIIVLEWMTKDGHCAGVSTCVLHGFEPASLIILFFLNVFHPGLAFLLLLSLGSNLIY